MLGDRMAKPWLCTERKLGIHDRCTLRAISPALPMVLSLTFVSPFSPYNISANIPTISNVNRDFPSSRSNQRHITAYRSSYCPANWRLLLPGNIMPRKDFQRDLIGAKTPSRFPHLSGVRAGDHDGSITFTFADASTGTRIDFQAIVSGEPSSGPSTRDWNQLTSR